MKGRPSCVPVLKVTVPLELGGEGGDGGEGEPADDLWKLDRRDSGSLFWRRDSAACKTSRVKFRCDVDVVEFLPQPEERLAGLPDQDPEEEEDIYSDDYILKHDMESSSSWLRPSLRPGNLFGYRRLRLPRKRVPGPVSTHKESSVFMSLMCVMAILVTAWLQGSISPINL